MSFNLRKMDKVELRLYSNSEELCSKPSRMTQWKRNQKRLSLPTVHFYILLLKGVRKHRRFTDNPDTPLWLPQRKSSFDDLDKWGSLSVDYGNKILVTRSLF